MKAFLFIPILVTLLASCSNPGTAGLPSETIAPTTLTPAPSTTPLPPGSRATR